ncbi:MAG: SDR family NAD(P)-dependent oxidoreductase [Pseudomonadota bacterium]
MAEGCVLIAGYGPGLGRALAHAFGVGGRPVIGLRRTPDPADPTPQIAVDLADGEAVDAAVATIADSHGRIGVAIHNPGAFLRAPLAETDPTAFEAVWRATTLSALHLGRAVLPAMAQAGGGAFLVSGATASLRGGAHFAAFASAKFALRGLVQAFAREWQPQGVHVAHVLIDGVIWSHRAESWGMEEAACMAATDIAAAYVALADQPPSAWTHELDLRPFNEKF